MAIESALSNEPNLLRKEVGDALNNLQKFIMENMTIDLMDGSYHFGNDICSRLPLCPISNLVVQLFYDSYFSEKVKFFYINIFFLI